MRKRISRHGPLLPALAVIAAVLFLLVPILLVAWSFPRGRAHIPPPSQHIQKPHPLPHHSPHPDSNSLQLFHKQDTRWVEFMPRKVSSARQVLVQLTHPGNPSTLMGGLPRFRANFARDSIVSALLMNDTALLLRQLQFSAMHQGKKQNPQTGEEAGKIAHEIPGTFLNQKSTEFAACDSTALFIIGVARAVKNSDNPHTAARLQREFQPAVVDGVRYILSHLRDGLFTEIPELAGAKEFALRVTYWKDSLRHECLKRGVPTVYTLAHAMNLRALVLADGLLPQEQSSNLQLQKHIEEMREGLNRLWDAEAGLFYAARTANDCRVRGASSDSLHALFYLSPGTDLSAERAKSIENASTTLETEIGYKTESGHDAYHSNNAWPFEQALIHTGALQHGLVRAAEVSGRMFDALVSVEGIFPEYFTLSPLASGGCTFQQWSVAAFLYFTAQQNSEFACDKNNNNNNHNNNNSKLIPWEWVNDNYCDCKDGTDEFKTSACSNGKFWCEVDRKNIYSSRVRDGIRDCSDGEDETPLTL